MNWIFVRGRESCDLRPDTVGEDRLLMKQGIPRGCYLRAFCVQCCSKITNRQPSFCLVVPHEKLKIHPLDIIGREKCFNSKFFECVGKIDSVLIPLCISACQMVQLHVCKGSGQRRHTKFETESGCCKIPILGFQIQQPFVVTDPHCGFPQFL